MDAAKSIAHTYGIPIDGMPAHKPTLEPEPPPGPREDPVEKTSLIDEERTSRVRMIAAEFYHQRLLANPKALAYQTEIRKHSIETLERYKVGLSGGNLRKYCEDHEVSTDELLAVGLMRVRGKGVGPYISNSYFTYPHMLRDKCLYISIKPWHQNQHKYQIYKKFAGKGWVCYGQEILAQDQPIIVVEGENDFLSVVGKAQHPHAMATLGSFNEPEIMKELKQRAKGKVFYLAFDRDPAPSGKGEGAGARYRRRYSVAILEGGGVVRVIKIEPGPDGQKRDIDDILREAEDPVAKFKDLMGAAVEVKEKSKTASTKMPDLQKTREVLNGFGDSFRVLGEAEDGSLVFESLFRKKIYNIPVKELGFDRMLQVAGPKLVSSVYHREKVPEGLDLVSYRAFKTEVILDAGERQLGHLRFAGQGLHTKKDGHLVTVVGGDVWEWDGEDFKIYDNPMIDDRIIQKNTGKEWIDFPLVMKKVQKMSRSDAFEIREKIVHLINQWRFVGPWDHYLAAGWMLAQFCQTAWSWRTHCWVSGQAGSGKTLLTLLFETLGGPLSKRREGSNITEPALRQDIGIDAALSLLDEIEKSESRDKIMNMARSASRGGWVPIGSQTQRPSYFYIAHMLMFVSIEPGLIRAADRSRYIQIDTLKDDTRAPKIPNTAEAEELRVEILAYVLRTVFRARELIKDLGKIPGFEDRTVEAFAVPLSMLAASDENPFDSLKWGVSAVLDDWKMRQQRSILDDERQVFHAILNSKIRVIAEEEDPNSLSGGTRPVYVERTAGQLIEDDAERFSKDLQANGLKAVKGGVFIVPAMVEESLLKSTRWKGLNVRGLLKRLPGAEEKQLRLSGHKNPQWGVLVPDSVSAQDVTNVT